MGVKVRNTVVVIGLVLLLGVAAAPRVAADERALLYPGSGRPSDVPPDATACLTPGVPPEDITNPLCNGWSIGPYGYLPPGWTYDANGYGVPPANGPNPGGSGSSDGDEDGVRSSADTCSDTAVDEAVDASGCSSNQRDDDGDGVLGGVEVFVGSDPMTPDTDGDGLSDSEEIYESDGITVKAIPDADGDGVLDVLESNIDVDGDGLSLASGDDDETDACVPDTTVDVCDQDGDGLTNGEETAAGSDPTHVDTDGDGVPDGGDQDNTTPSGASVDANGVTVTTTSVAATTTTIAVTTDDDSSSGLIAAAAGFGGLLLVGLIAFSVRRRRTPG